MRNFGKFKQEFWDNFTPGNEEEAMKYYKI